jgi:hypothetical protein
MFTGVMTDRMVGWLWVEMKRKKGRIRYPEMDRIIRNKNGATMKEWTF